MAKRKRRPKENNGPIEVAQCVTCRKTFLASCVSRCTTCGDATCDFCVPYCTCRVRGVLMWVIKDTWEAETMKNFVLAGRDNEEPRCSRCS